MIVVALIVVATLAYAGLAVMTSWLLWRLDGRPNDYESLLAVSLCGFVWPCVWPVLLAMLALAAVDAGDAGGIDL